MSDLDPLTDLLQVPPTSDLKSALLKVNRHFRVIVERLNHLEGAGGRTPTIHNAPSFMGNRVKKVGKSLEGDDAMTRAEVLDLVSQLQDQIDALRTRLGV